MLSDADNFSEKLNWRIKVDNFTDRIDFERLIQQSAQRKPLGNAPKQHDLYLDETPEAIWAWELVSPSLYIEPASLLREVQKTRESLSSQAQLIQSLAKLITCIGKAKALSDLTSVTTQHAKYIKLVQKRKETTTKLQAKAL